MTNLILYLIATCWMVIQATEVSYMLLRVDLNRLPQKAGVGPAVSSQQGVISECSGPWQSLLPFLCGICKMEPSAGQ